MAADMHVRIPLRVNEQGAVRLRVSDDPPTTFSRSEYVEQRVIATDDYSELTNLPQIDGVTLVGNRTAAELGVRPIGNAAILDLFR